MGDGAAPGGLTYLSDHPGMGAPFAVSVSRGGGWLPMVNSSYPEGRSLLIGNPVLFWP